MDPVRLGVIGCGVIGQHHLASAQASPLIEIAALSDLRADLANESAEKFGVDKTYPKGEALLEDAHVQAVVLAMPTQGRTSLALRAFEKGKHVLVEKPVAMNADEVRQMIAAKGDLKAACCSSRHRFLESAQVITDFLARDGLGELRLLRCRASGPAGERPEQLRPAWRLIKALNGGGILMNWGCYDLDYLLGVTGWSLKPKKVLAQTWTVPPRFESHVAPGSDAETHYAALITCEGGVTISLERGEYMPAGQEDSWQIIGSQGALRFRMTAQKGKTIVHDEASTEKGVVSKTLWEGDEDNSTGQHGVVHDFAEAICEGREPKTTLERALIVQRITDAIYASAAQGIAVDMA